MTALRIASLTWPSVQTPCVEGQVKQRQSMRRNASGDARPARADEAEAGMPSRPWKPWLCCALVSLAAHGFMLSRLDVSPDPGARQVTARLASRPHGDRAVMQVRTVEAFAPKSVQPVTPATPAAEPLPPRPARPETGPESTRDPEDVAEPQTVSRTTDSSHAGEFDAYLPRSALSLTPAPMQPVLLVSPEEAGMAPGRRTGVLSLFIDESGRVHHIVPEEPRLPPRYEEAARAAFMAAMFRPGERDGAAVKSRIRIEVVFDNTPLDAP